MRYVRCGLVRPLILVGAMLSTGALGAEVSLLSGLFSKTSEKADGKNAGSTSTFGLGGRFHDDLGGSLAWFASAGLFTQSYTAPDGRSSPSNAVNLSLGGGVRNYFKPFGTAVVPFGAVSADVRNEKSVTWKSSGYEETSSNGIHYGASLGIRAGLDSNFFVEIELPLFDSALFNVAKTVDVNESTGTKVETKSEKTTTSLWVDGAAGINSAVIAVGYKF